jgi:hypothetical protein
VLVGFVCLLPVTFSKHIFEAKQEKAEDSRLKAAHDEQDRSLATSAMGMHIGIDAQIEIISHQRR